MSLHQPRKNSRGRKMNKAETKWYGLIILVIIVSMVVLRPYSHDSPNDPQNISFEGDVPGCTAEYLEHVLCFSAMNVEYSNVTFDNIYEYSGISNHSQSRFYGVQFYLDKIYDNGFLLILITSSRLLDSGSAYSAWTRRDDGKPYAVVVFATFNSHNATFVNLGYTGAAQVDVPLTYVLPPEVGS